MNEIYDVLETCLQEIENGADLEAVLGHYPDLEAELRPILNASIVARSRRTVVSDPSPEAVRRGRAKLLQRAAEMREVKVAPRKRMIPLFQRLAISFTLAAIFLGSGTGLVSASSSALPGENLYPVKLTWENMRLFFAFNKESREILEHSFENERLHEVNELFVEGKKETIRFSGVYKNVNGIAYVSGIRITILSSSKLPTGPLIDGAAVSVIGHTNAQGYVDVDSIEILPAGTAVPTGEPVELDSEDNSAGNGGSGRISESKIENESNNSDDGSEDKIDKQDQGEKVIGNSGSDDGGSDGSGDNNSGTSQSGKNDGNDDHGGGDNSGSGGGDDNSGSGGGDD
jgi:uncharacterized membrane protein YgcG